MNQDKKSKVIKILFIVIFFVVITALVVITIPLIKFISSDEGRIKLKEIVQSAGVFGPLVYIGFVVIQIIVALIPGEPIEILGGVLFGGITGFLLCLIGVFIGTIIIYFLVKKFGERLVASVIDIEKIQNMKFLNNEKKLETFVFILFLIPGTPKDALTYIVPLTKINPVKYFTYSTLARIPSVVSSTFVGSSISDGNFVMSIVILIITGAIGLVGILYKDKVIAHRRRKK